MPKPPAVTRSVQPKEKIVYIDHLKVVLTVLVIMHHAFITYGAPGGWYWRPLAVFMVCGLGTGFGL